MHLQVILGIQKKVGKKGRFSSKEYGKMDSIRFGDERKRSRTIMPKIRSIDVTINASIDKRIEHRRPRISV
jgi:hypothetical protein